MKETFEGNAKTEQRIDLAEKFNVTKFVCLKAFKIDG